MEIQPHHATKDGWSRIGYTRPPLYPHPPHQQYTHTHRQRSRPRLNASTISSSAATSTRCVWGIGRIGRIHSPPAAQNAPGQARYACSSGYSRSGAPGTLMWGLEEFTHIMFPTGLPALSSPRASCRASSGCSYSLEHVQTFQTGAMQQDRGARVACS